ncbi:glycine-rich cell wall structural protein 1.8-like [Dendronephthya gigantea]|uniref:glycine-rich cell wall structural protein 1.8-like n=1 Tax=Dendronephthya gigantea TaxID=151771 RepID=UPI0010694D48|nr:glycine-rich cell wall structural protein 1.8-like [Dendronephthya gigantea]
MKQSTCKSSIFKLYHGRFLPNHVIKSMPVTSQVDCSMLCSRHDDCESWNLIETLFGLECELNNATIKNGIETNLVAKHAAIFGSRLDNVAKKAANVPKPQEISYVFTNLGTEGADGPTDTSGYQGTALEGLVTIQNRIQEWFVPHTGTYEIESRGASGANGSCEKGFSNTKQLGGLGARLSGRFLLSQGDLLKILVGQRGIMGITYGDRPGGGGGGSFVTYGNNTPLVIAGGGGGGGGCKVIEGKPDGDPGQLGLFGSRCSSTVENGGMLCLDTQDPTAVLNAGSGAGLLGDGNGANPPGTDSKSFVNGGRGGTIHIGSHGGFGGGGYGWEYPGGGGGYTGAGVWGNSTYGVAGGGGSVNLGFDTKSGYGGPGEHGLVRIVFIHN